MDVAVVMGSPNDMPVVAYACDILKDFGINYKHYILSVHRTPRELMDFVVTSDAKVFIAAAGGAAHLAGFIASLRPATPVIALPISGNLLGLDALLSMVQMPAGTPVSTVAINGGLNAGLLAAQILSLTDESLKHKLILHREKMKEKILKENDKL